MCPNILDVTLTQCRHGKPLVVIESSIGNGSELRPEQLRALAAALCAAADDAEQRVMYPKACLRVKKLYPLDAVLPTDLAATDAARGGDV